jgi:hypothetical protein
MVYVMKYTFDEQLYQQIYPNEPNILSMMQYIYILQIKDQIYH